MTTPVYWSSPVKDCDCCGTPFKKTAPIYDARTKSGPWGLMCHSCFKLDGIKLGTGWGQKYVFQTAGDHKDRWLKVEG